MLREVARTVAALARHAGSPAGAATATETLSISKARAWMQLALTVLLVPLCLWVLFGSAAQGDLARQAASVLLGAVVTFWLKD